MRREELVDLNAFAAVADEQSFTRAAAKLGTSQSALSHTINRLEAHVGVRLLTRTTRKVAPTEAGERLLRVAGAGARQYRRRRSPRSASCATSLPARSASPPRSTRRMHVLWPALERLLPDYPDVHVELHIESGFTDIVEQRFDAGVRLGESIAKDMVAVRIGPDVRMAVVGSPGYFAKHPKPKTPQDLAPAPMHQPAPADGGRTLCLGAREGPARTEGSGRRPIGVQQCADDLARRLAGFGLACVLEDQTEAYVADGRLVRVLEDWCPPFPGYHLYYPSRRQPSAAFALLVDALRYRGSIHECPISLHAAQPSNSSTAAAVFCS